MSANQVDALVLALLAIPPTLVWLTFWAATRAIRFNKLTLGFKLLGNGGRWFSLVLWAGSIALLLEGRLS